MYQLYQEIGYLLETMQGITLGETNCHDKYSPSRKHKSMVYENIVLYSGHMVQQTFIVSIHFQSDVYILEERDVEEAETSPSCAYKITRIGICTFQHTLLLATFII